jgi:hypothetical protein
VEAGVDPASVERLLRVWGESMRRMTEAAANFYHTQIELPLLRSGMSEGRMMQVANEAVAAGIPSLDRALVSMYHGHSEHVWLANVVESVEAILEKSGLHHTVAEPRAIAFFDLSATHGSPRSVATRPQRRWRRPLAHWCSGAPRSTKAGL